MKLGSFSNVCQVCDLNFNKYLHRKYANSIFNLRCTFFSHTSEKCYGGKYSKERVTVMVGANMTGTQKLKLLVIGKSLKPRPFKNVKKDSLPVTYEANKKAWMLSEVFRRWLKRLDDKFTPENRKVLLFLDNCSGEL
jgi:DDE superfamily endonuclease